MMEGLDRLAKSSESVERSQRIAAETGANPDKFTMYIRIVMLL